MAEERTLRVLIADDEEVVHKTLGGYLRRLGHEVDDAHDGEAAVESADSSDYDLLLLDVRMPKVNGLEVLARLRSSQPELSVVLITGHGTMDMAIEALRLGAADFLKKPIKLQELDAVLEKAVQLQKLRANARRLEDAIDFIQSAEDREVRGHQLVGESEATEEVRNQIRLAVERRFDTVLVSGETGTGKEVVAREIHRIAARATSRSAPFIAVSCPAIPETLIESELFGHVKGAFTGATDPRSGSFEMAEGGTLFLDEIADLSPAAQAKILRALETRSVRRVGGVREIPVNVRIVAATNVPLEELVEKRAFRRDLFYRLAVFTIALEPLRRRRDDIVPIAEHFIRGFAASRGLAVTGLTDEAKATLRGHRFDGNARELRNVIERATALRGRGLVERADLALGRATVMPGTPPPTPPPTPTPGPEQTERSRIALALDRARWNRREAARLLDMPYSTLRYKIRKYGLD